MGHATLVLKRLRKVCIFKPCEIWCHLDSLEHTSQVYPPGMADVHCKINAGLKSGEGSINMLLYLHYETLLQQNR